MKERSETTINHHTNQYMHSAQNTKHKISKFNETDKSCMAHNDFLHIFRAIVENESSFRHCMHACHCLRFHGCWLLFSNVQTKDVTSPQMDFIRYTIPIHEVHEAMMHSIYSFVLFFIFCWFMFGSNYLYCHPQFWSFVLHLSFAVRVNVLFSLRWMQHCVVYLCLALYFINSSSSWLFVSFEEFFLLFFFFSFRNLVYKI